MRALVVAAAFLGASYLLSPELWSTYFARGGDIASRLLDEAHGGYSAADGTVNMLLVITVVGLGLLALVDLRAAGWLAGPALVPASQFHLSTMAMPILANGPNLALTVLYALPVHRLPSAIIAVYGVWRCYDAVRKRRMEGGR
jgi:hypothetical protein